MSTLMVLIKRNSKLFFKDKGMFFSSLITPIILLVLFVTFLGNVYKDAFLGSLPPDFTVSDSVINGLVGAQVFSSIIAVSCVTVAFCSNLLLVQDKVYNSITDFTITPVKKSTLAIGYYFSTLIVTLIICYSAAAICLIYIACIGWFYSFTDILFLLLNIFLLSMFGTALSSIVNVFLKTQGQMSAVGTIVSCGYGFICGAYMSISQFSTGIRNVLAFLPSTYGTALFKNYALNGVISEMERLHVPETALTEIKKTLDANVYFFDTKVEVWTMYLIIIATTVGLIGLFVLVNYLLNKKKA